MQHQQQTNIQNNQYGHVRTPAQIESKDAIKLEDNVAVPVPNAVQTIAEQPKVERAPAPVPVSVSVKSEIRPHSSVNHRSSRVQNNDRPSYKEESASDDDEAHGEDDDDDDELEFKEEESKVKAKVHRDSPRKRKPPVIEVACEEPAPIKKKLKRLERKIPAFQTEKCSPEELMETNTYQRFSRLVETIFDATDDADLHATADADDDAEVPQEAMISKQQLHDLCAEAAKLKVSIVYQLPIRFLMYIFF